MNWPNNAPTFQLKTPKKKKTKQIFKTRESRSGNSHIADSFQEWTAASAEQMEEECRTSCAATCTIHDTIHNCWAHARATRSRVLCNARCNHIYTLYIICIQTTHIESVTVFNELRVTLNTLVFIVLLRTRASECGAQTMGSFICFCRTTIDTFIVVAVL